LLDDSANALQPQLLHKLEAARMRAVAAHSAAVAGNVGLGALLGEYLHHRRLLMSAALLCSAIVIAFVVTQQFSGQDSLEQGDAFLLGSELPPEAFLDKGFNTWLEETSQH